MLATDMPLVEPLHLLDIVLPNAASSNYSKSTLKTHVRLLSALYELHNYARSNNRPIRSIESGAKMLRRLMNDVKTRGRIHRARRSKRSNYGKYVLSVLPTDGDVT